MCNKLKEKFEELGITEIDPVSEEPHGSSDIGAVSYRCPALHGYVKIADCEVAGHSKEMADETVSSEGEKGLIDSAGALAELGYDLITNPNLLEEVKKEFKETVK